MRATILQATAWTAAASAVLNGPGSITVPVLAAAAPLPLLVTVEGWGGLHATARLCRDCTCTQHSTHTCHTCYLGMHIHTFGGFHAVEHVHNTAHTHTHTHTHTRASHLQSWHAHTHIWLPP